MGTLREMVTHLRHREQVHERWGVADKSARGLGLVGLFSGPSGTGKPMAADVIARCSELVTSQRVTYTSPKGAKASIDWIEDELRLDPTLTIEVFNDAGQMEAFTIDSLRANPKGIRAFLGL